MLQIINNNIVDVNTITGYWFVVTDDGVTEGLTKDEAIRIAKENI